MDNTSNLRTVLLEIAEVAVTSNSLVGKLDPFGSNTSLLQEINDTMLVGDMRAGTACKSNVLDLGNFSELVDCSSLHVTAAVGRSVVADEFVSKL